MADEEKNPNDVFDELIKKEFNEDEDTPSVIALTPDMLTKRVLWDMLPCHSTERERLHQVRDMLELQPSSDEVEEQEHQDSHLRATAIQPILPYVAAFAQHTAIVTRAAMMVGNDETGPINPEEVVEAEKLAAILMASAVSIVAELVDIGVLHLPHWYVMETPDNG